MQGFEAGGGPGGGSNASRQGGGSPFGGGFGAGDGNGDGDFFWKILLVASSIAAGVSLLTTGLGLGRYVSLPLAWSLAFAVQMGLFGLAWLIGTGRGKQRAWISALYLLTMLFSVTFSYVTLQSELTAEIRPAEAQRRLFDTARSHLADTARRMNEGVRTSSELRLRLGSWLDMEQKNGWATSTCEEEDHCYMSGVCDRISRRIERWEKETGRQYREGPGEKMIYGTLETELRSLEQVEASLRAYQKDLTENPAVLEDGLDNRERLRRLDELANRAPVGELESVICEAAALPALPSYLDHARDRASGEEQPTYAFQDLMTILDSEEPLRREDYPTLFALALALFIDLFVLAVAFGASTLREAHPLMARRWSSLDGAPLPFERALRRDIEGWIDGALLHHRKDPGVRADFLAALLASIDFDRAGGPHLLPTDEEQRRFGHLMVQDRAAVLESYVHYNRMGRKFALEPWVLPALNRHLRGDGDPMHESDAPEAPPRVEPAAGLSTAEA